MTGAEALEWLNAALAVASLVRAVGAERRGDYAEGAYRMAWAVLFAALAYVTRMG